MSVNPTDDLAAITAIDQRFGRRWTISYHPVLGNWSAERRSADGRSIRYICARTGDELAAKVETAQTVEP